MKTLINLGILVFIAGILLFAFLGVYNRFYADDWCYAASFKELGFLGALGGYTHITYYASNRFSLTLFSGLFPGIAGTQLLTICTILMWLLGLFWLLSNICKITKSELSTVKILLPAAIIVYFSLYLAPHLYQSIYWRAGLLPYTAPLVFSLWLFALITQQGLRDKPSNWIKVLTGLIAFLAGGFSEAGSAYLAAALGIYLLIAVIGRSHRRSWATQSLFTAGVALVFVAIAMLLLILSPTSQLRMQNYGEPASLLQLLILTFSLTYHFVRLSLIDFPLPHLIFILSFGALAFISRSPARSSGGPLSKTIYFILIVSGVALILLAATMAPSAYIEQAPPAARTRIILRFIMFGALAVIAWSLGYALRKYLSGRWFSLAAAFVLLLSYGYTIRSIVLTAQKVDTYSSRAQLWDERDQLIQAAKQQGARDIYVYGIDGQPVGGLRDFKAEPTNWINICASVYYEVNTINATLP